MKPWDDFSREELIELVEQLTEQSKTEEAQLAAAKGEMKMKTCEKCDYQFWGNDGCPNCRWQRKINKLQSQLTAAEKRASKAERMASEIRPYEQMLAKALLKAFDRIGIEIVHNALGSDASWVRNDLQTLAETNHMPARAQAVAKCVQELRNIADASPKKWECTPDAFRADFVDWAQSRATHTLAKLDALDKE